MRWMNSKDGVFAYGLSWGYLVVRSDRDVRLSRFSIDLVASNLTAAVAAETVRNVIVFPLGRGPGRPGGEPELAALVKFAKDFAEQYEGGRGFEEYPAWRRKCRECRGTGLVEAEGCTCGAGGYPWPGHEPYCGTQPCPAGCEFAPPSAARFPATGDANDCPSC